MKIAVFDRTRETTPLGNITVAKLDQILTTDYILERRTLAVRSAADPARFKLQLPGVCLGGVFKALSPDDDHGRAVPSHDPAACRGYRNGRHLDWSARTGLVLIDIDDLQPPATPDAVKFLLRHSAPAISLTWTSARGRGLKLGVKTSPIPAAGQHIDAWSTAYAYVVEVLKASGMAESVDFKIDSTPAASQMEILAHDPSPFVRTAERVVKWTPTPAGADRPAFQRAFDPLSPASTIGGLVEQLSWTPGSRSNSMHRLGIAAATSGLGFETSRAAAQAVGQTTGLIRDCGDYPALRHFDRGFWWARESLLDGFGWNNDSDGEGG